MILDEPKFDPKKLFVNLEGDQTGPIRDRKKAWRMAEVEDYDRFFLDQYKAYEKDPRKFLAEYRDVTPREVWILETLREKKVPIDYMLRLIELDAEIEGELYDFRQKLKEYDSEYLLELLELLDNSLKASESRKNDLETPSGTIYDRGPIAANYELRYVRDALKYNAIRRVLRRRGIDF